MTHRLRQRLSAITAATAAPSPTIARAAARSSAGRLRPGVERLAEEVRAPPPDCAVAILTSDEPAGPNAVAALLGAMRDDELDLLIGTQIIAKGHHFPDLTLVGVVDGDLGLAGGDLRAAERQFQLLYQVAGRAGRGGAPRPGPDPDPLPEHPVMQALAAATRTRFYARSWPSGATRHAAVRAAGGADRHRPGLQAVRRLAAAGARRRRRGCARLGPAPAPLLCCAAATASACW